MSRTFKDAPRRVRAAHAKSGVASHYHCQHSTTGGRHRLITHEELRPYAWLNGPVYPVNCCHFDGWADETAFLYHMRTTHGVMESDLVRFDLSTGKYSLTVRPRVKKVYGRLLRIITASERVARPCDLDVSRSGKRGIRKGGLTNCRWEPDDPALRGRGHIYDDRRKQAVRNACRRDAVRRLLSTVEDMEYYAGYDVYWDEIHTLPLGDALDRLYGYR